VRRITRNDWGRPISCEVEYEDLFNPMLLAQVERVDSKTGKTVKGPNFTLLKIEPFLIVSGNW